MGSEKSWSLSHSASKRKIEVGLLQRVDRISTLGEMIVLGWQAKICKERDKIGVSHLDNVGFGSA